MDLPIRSFWFMNSNVGRLLAEKDLRAITVQSTRHGGEQMENVMKHLNIEIGETEKVKNEQINAVRDEEGFGMLKGLAGLM